MPTQKKALVCWIGGKDLAAAEKNDDSFGPILSTLQARPHDQVHLLYNYPDSRVGTYCSWLKNQLAIEAVPHKTDIRNPIHFGDIYQAAAKLLDNLMSQMAAADMSLLISPGTPAMQSIWILMGKTTYPIQMLESSAEQGVQEAEIPFDISAEYIPNLLAESDATLRRLAGGTTSTNAGFEDIITQSPQMLAQIDRAQKIAERDIPVLILGESGTGKELFARAIHRASSRATHNNGEPITVNCGAIPPELVDSVLFGHAKGSFTGAIADKEGFFSAADGGTIFLDEFGELPKDTQVRLLRVLEDGTFNRIGDQAQKKVDVRVVAATNRELMQEISGGNFREDLFYRVAVGIVNLPPLRERQGDLALLTDKLLESINDEASRKLPAYKHKKISPKAKNIIMAHGWPGNVRELQATLTRASVWAETTTISEQEIRDALLQRPEADTGILAQSLDNPVDIQELIKTLKKHYIDLALEKTHGNKTNAASLLGLNSYQTLNTWIKDVGIKE
jgi:transcriptional regulator with PAS, ATPase and Fis domain